MPNTIIPYVSSISQPAIICFMNIRKLTLTTFFVVFAVLVGFTATLAYGEESFKARIVELSSEKCVDFEREEYEGTDDDCVKITLLPVSGIEQRDQVESLVNLTHNPLFETQKYKEGDIVFVNAIERVTADPSADSEGQGVDVEYYIVEVDRSKGLVPLVLVFLVLVVAIGRVRGASSLLGLAISVFAVFGLLVPLILQGKDPLLFGGLIATGILLVSVYLSHGFDRKSTLALLGILVAVIITILVAVGFTALSRISGFGTEEAYFLVEKAGVEISMSKVFIASIILGTVGILDDVAVSQVGFVKELKRANPDLGAKELFTRSMVIGRDHIASMINTLFLVYAGAALPLVLLFQLSGLSFGEIIHYEQFAEEIVRTVVGSIGLVLAVPISAFIASESYAKKTPTTNAESASV